MLTNDLSKIWDRLGSFWSDFPDKDIFTNIWKSYYDLTQNLLTRKENIVKNRFLADLQPVFNFVSEEYAYPYKTTYPTKSVPILSGIASGTVYNEDVDYTISDYQYINFTSEVTENLYAPSREMYNPLLWEIYAKGIDLKLSSMINSEYTPLEINTDIETHYKYLIWALVNIKKTGPSISNLEKGFNISKGYPFSYEKGTVTSVSSGEMVIGNLTYNYPSTCIAAFEEGDEINRFDVLIHGCTLKDYFNTPSMYSNMPPERRYSIVYFYHNPSLVFDHNEDYHLDYIKSIMPKSLNYIIREE